MIAIDVPHARRLALGVVLGQAVVTVIVALLSWALVDPAAALSAVLGGGISTAASLAMVLLSFGRTARMDPQYTVLGFFVGEAVKLAVVIVLFVVVLRLIKISPVPMLVAYGATFLVYWAVLAAGLPAWVAMRQRRIE